MRISKRLFPIASILVLALCVAGAHGVSRGADEFATAIIWPEEQRAFLQDGPGLLLRPAQLEELFAGDRIARQQLIDDFLDRDPIPETPDNELREGIRRRRELVGREYLSLLDDRARLLFLHGLPDERRIIDCVEVYKPLEVWTYPKSRVGIDDPEQHRLVLYRPKPGEPYRLWLPIDSKRVLYNEEMEYYMQQWEENRGQITGKRFDKQLCDEAEDVDLVTGVDGLFGFRPGRPQYQELQAYLEPPASLGAWAAHAAATPLEPRPGIPGGELELAFPERAGQRMETHFVIVLPPEAELGILEHENDRREMRLTVEGEIERRGEIFEIFRMRFLLQPTGEPVPVALVAPRRLRPQEGFVARLRVIDEITGREARFARGFVVPREPTPNDALPMVVPPEAIVALGDELRKQRVAGHDSLILVPPESDVVFGLWRADALVTGARISSVLFFLDGKQVFKRSRPPFSAELRLPPFPVEQVVRAEGFDAEGTLLASDEVVLNQPRGQLQVRILEPPRGNDASGPTRARVEVVVPEERKVTRVTFSVDETEQTVLEKPPWETTIEAPGFGGARDLHYLTVSAELDDGSRAEDVRFLNPPAGIDEVDVNLVELYTTVTEKNGRLVKGLGEESFQIFEDDRAQRIAKFELVEDLPLTLGITIDTSGSMFESLSEAKRAAVDFLENIITPKDLTFALAFADRPELLMARTSDVGAVEARLENLLANGTTSLHDAVVTSLYYFRGIRGRRALVLLSDGEDTSSTIEFPEALEYARISGVAIYSIGLRIGGGQVGVRKKLESLAEQTGGRTFYIKQAAELHSVYDEIEEELRSQYLVAYNSDQTSEPGVYREVRVEVRDAKGRKLNARTIRGYYP